MTEDTSNVIEQVSEQITVDTYRGLDVLNKAREKAIEEGIPILAYMVAVFLEYLEMREQADAVFDSAEIAELVQSFEVAYKTGMLKAKSPPPHDPAYA